LAVVAAVAAATGLLPPLPWRGRRRQSLVAWEAVEEAERERGWKGGR
jgi:hypothetical protein